MHAVLAFIKWLEKKAEKPQKSSSGSGEASEESVPVKPANRTHNVPDVAPEQSSSQYKDQDN